jgi:exodeoxyribonuclease VII small subunit
MATHHSFIQLTTELETALSEIDDEHTSLEDAVKKYSNALKLAQKAQSKLATIKNQITILNDKNDTLIKEITGKETTENDS